MTTKHRCGFVANTKSRRKSRAKKGGYTRKNIRGNLGLGLKRYKRKD